MSDSLQPHGLQHTKPPYPSATPGVYTNSCPLNRWCHPSISSSGIPFSSSIQTFSASVQFNSFAQSCLTDSLWPHEPEHARPPCPSQTPGVYTNSCPLSWWCHLIISSSVTPSPPAFNLSQRQGIFQWVSASHQVAKVLEFQLQHQSFQWIFRTDFLQDGLVWSPCSPRDSQESSPTPQFKSINSSALSFLYCSNLTYIHDYWKNHRFD